MDPTQVVYYPYVVMLHNLPVERDATGKLRCRYSNHGAASLIAEFVGKLKNTVKIVYQKDGVVLYNDAAFAYAQFNEFHHAMLLSELFKSTQRGKSDYEKALQTLHSPLNNDVVYGWMAEESDFKLLAARGTKQFWQKRVKRTVQEVIDEQEREYAEVQRQLKEQKEDMAALDEELNKDQERLNKLLAELSEAKLKIQTELSKEDKEREKRNEELNRAMKQCEEEINELDRKEKMLKEEQKRSVFDEKERERLDNQKRVLEKRYMESKKKRDECKRRCREEEEELAQLEKSMQDEKRRLEEERRQTEELEEAIKSLVATEEDAKMMNIRAVAEAGLNLGVSECVVCLANFTRVMTFDEQLQAGISSEEFEAMNHDSDSDQRHWRNVAIPCAHAYVCGPCAWDLMENAREKECTLRCPCCKAVVERFLPLRISHN